MESRHRNKTHIRTLYRAALQKMQQAALVPIALVNTPDRTLPRSLKMLAYAMQGAIMALFVIYLCDTNV